VSNLLQIELNQGFSIWKRSCGYILGFKLPNNNKVKIQASKTTTTTEIQASKQHQSKIQAFKQQQNKIQASKTTTTEIQALKRTATELTSL